MMYVRYTGKFLSHSGEEWRCRILQEADQPFSSIGRLTFPASEPLTIEGPETGKETPLCGSTATLTVISPSDRTYQDLYTDKPGSIRLDVLREGVLYWTGCLDPEFYEEPYSSASDYEVSLTFQDFGILHRLTYNMSGLKLASDILEDAMDRGNLSALAVDQSMISTKLSADDAASLQLSSISVRSDNFFDEDGIPATLYDTLEGILQPLALKMVQRAGKIWIYDINGLYHSAGSSPITWCSKDQTMGVDRVFNNAKVTFSVYGDPKLSDDFEYTGEAAASMINLYDFSSSATYFTYHEDLSSLDADMPSFTIFTKGTAKGLSSINPDAMFFKIVPLFGGEEGEGVVDYFYVKHQTWDSGQIVRKGCPAPQSFTPPAVMPVLYETEQKYLPTLSGVQSKRLRINIRMLADARYNPFTEPSEDNEQANYDSYRNWGSIGAHSACRPAKIEILDANGTVLCHYDNQAARANRALEYPLGLEDLIGEWKSGPAAEDGMDCMLEWRNKEAKGEDLYGNNLAFVGDGWLGNRQAASPHCRNYLQHGLMPAVCAIDDGQYLPYPPAGGYLRIRLGTMTFFYAEVTGLVGVGSLLRWMLVEAPEIAIVESNAVLDEADIDDVEYTGVLNGNAKEEISLDTICGTMAKPSPVAKGLLFDASGSAITTLTRNGRTAQAEQLLIGTLYSQFAARKTRLAGTAELLGEGIIKLTDDAQEDGVVFMLTADRQDIIAAESEMEMIEISEDNYTSED